MNEKVVLLVEDNPNDILLAKRAFKKFCLDSKIIVAHDGIEALEYLLGNGDENGCKALPAVVLLDLKMPRMNGIETLQEIRKHRKTANLPVIILTSSDEEQDMIRSYKFGANSYIRKPIDYNKFQELVQQLGLYWLTMNEVPPNLGNS